MNRLFFSFGMAAVFFSMVTPVFAVAQPKASCGDAAFVIANLPQDGRRVAVRIDDKANGWDLENPVKGDVATLVTPRDGRFSFKAINEHTYSWWVHLENADGTFGRAYGGETYCGAAIPASFSASCKDDKISLTWKKVASAERYAVRIDDTQNSWDPKNVLPGDTAVDTVTGTKFSTAATVGHGYNIWIHAVDTKGIFSSPKETFLACKKNAQSVGFLQSLRNFFTGFFS
jgi:hypothetical protein